MTADDLTALMRAGVAFTVEQKKAIESMVEAGDLDGAQRLVMAEVESQFGRAG